MKVKIKRPLIQLVLLITFASGIVWLKFNNEISDTSNLQELNCFERPLVSVTFDDGLESQFKDAIPVLDKYGIKATFFLASGLLDSQDHLTPSQVVKIVKDGHSLGSHGVNHIYLNNLSNEKLNYELKNSQELLSSKFNYPVIDFALPYGAYDEITLSGIEKYYRSNRTVEPGLNSIVDFNIYKIKSKVMELSEPVSDITDLVNQAKQSCAWLVLVYHDIDNNGDFFSVTPENFNLQMLELKKSGIEIVTYSRALDEISSQI